MNEEIMNREMERLQDLIATVQPGTDTYQRYVDDLEHLAEIRNKSRKNDSEIEETKANLRAQEKRNREDVRLKEEELLIKKKDSRRKVGVAILTTLGAVGQIVLVACFEEVKPLFGKAWNFVRKTPDTKL